MQNQTGKAFFFGTQSRNLASLEIRHMEGDTRSTGIASIKSLTSCLASVSKIMLLSYCVLLNVSYSCSIEKKY